MYVCSLPHAVQWHKWWSKWGYSLSKHYNMKLNKSMRRFRQQCRHLSAETVMCHHSEVNALHKIRLLWDTENGIRSYFENLNASTPPTTPHQTPTANPHVPPTTHHTTPQPHCNSTESCKWLTDPVTEGRQGGFVRNSLEMVYNHVQCCLLVNTTS